MTQHPTTFSIIVPAYNEEKLIAETLHHLADLNYPKDAYEVIVVVNGSTDATFEIAKKVAEKSWTIINTEEKGVSKARNLGIRSRTRRTDWAIILDADSFLKKEFLNELHAYVSSHPHAVYGTATPTPNDGSFIGRAWFGYMSIGVRILKVFCAVHILRSDILDKARYDETLVSSEDTMYARELATYGDFFCLSTYNFSTSTRRMDKKGYLKMFIVSASRGMLPKKILKNLDWELVR